MDDGAGLGRGVGRRIFASPLSYTQNGYMLWVLYWRMCFHCAPPILGLGSGMGSLLEIALMSLMRELYFLKL